MFPHLLELRHFDRRVHNSGILTLFNFLFLFVVRDLCVDRQRSGRAIINRTSRYQHVRFARLGAYHLMIHFKPIVREYTGGRFRHGISS